MPSTYCLNGLRRLGYDVMLTPLAAQPDAARGCAAAG
jgi:hypothetical protein